MALTEVLHFLQSDERLPGQSRLAVQFCNGLRTQMVYKKMHTKRPDLFECPVRLTSGHLWTFKQVRRRATAACARARRDGWRVVGGAFKIVCSAKA